MFELVQILVEDVSAENELIQQGEDKPEDIRRHAQEWVDQNRELFDNCVEAAQKVAQTSN